MLCVRVLGELELELDGVSADPPVSRRARSLLGLLALDRRLHPRPQLAARFWPDVLDDSARTSLRSALAAARRSLGPEADRYLIATRERVGLTNEVLTDAAEFEELSEAGRLDEAIALWRGDLLSGLDDDWVLAARDEWRANVAAVLDELAVRAEEGGAIEVALAHTRRMVALDPLGEEGQRALMRRLAASGDRAAALLAYNRYAERLRAELRVAPSSATRALAEDLRGSSDEVASPTAGTVTLLFTDLVGSTELLEDLGDERAERLRRVHFGLLREVALSHAGREVKNLGDGLMVAFGSSVDASACAVGIQQAVDRHNRRDQSDRLSVRVGLHVGEPIRDADDYFGTAVVVAKRLCDRAEGGQILVSELVRQLIGSRGGFAFRPAGELSLKGFSQPVSACELAWEPAGEQRIPLPAELDRHEGAFIGRQAERKALEDAWRDVCKDGSRVVLVAGEPGIGKTRLVAEFCRNARAGGATVLLGRSTEETLAPYQPFVETLRHYVASCPAEELLLQVGTRRGLLARLVPDLAGAEDRVLTRTETRAEGEQYALFDAVASLLTEAARDRPLILVLDDLHWADPPSVLLLRHVARSTRDAPLLILGTYRETEVDDDHPLASALADLRRSRALATLTLGGLDTGDVAALIRERGAQLGDELVIDVALRTEGNPFFVEEVVRQFDGGLPPSVPESVKDLLLRRLHGLNEAARQVLAAAAVLGRDFEFGELERMLGASGDELLDTMELALRERVLAESPVSIGSFAFAHTLIRETIYEQLSATRRARLHLRAGAALEALHAEQLDDYAEQLTYHFVEGGDEAKSFEHRQRAARAAARVHAAQTAIAHYGAGLETGGRLGLSPESDDRMRRMLVERAWLRHVCGDVEAGLADYTAALQAARAAGDARVEAEALDGMAFADKLSDVERAEEQHRAALAVAERLGDAKLQIRIMSRLSLVLSNQLDLEGALELGDRALALARRHGDSHDRALAIDALKLVALQLGECDRLDELTSELEDIERRRGELWYLQWTLFESAFVPLARAQWDATAARLAEARAVNARVGDRLFLPLIHDATGWFERSRGRYEQALAEGRTAVALTAPAGGRARWSAWAHATLGWTLLDLRASEAAVTVLERALAASELLADRLRAAGHLAWARTLAGDASGAVTASDLAEQALSQLKVPPGGTFLFGFGAIVALARAELATGRGDRAEALLAPMSAAAQRLGWHEAAAASSLGLGLCHEIAGDEERARSFLARAIEISRRHGFPGVEWEALATLTRLTGGDEAARLCAASDSIVERLARGIGDNRLAGHLLRASKR